MEAWISRLRIDMDRGLTDTVPAVTTDNGTQDLSLLDLIEETSIHLFVTRITQHGNPVCTRAGYIPIRAATETTVTVTTTPGQKPSTGHTPCLIRPA